MKVRILKEILEDLGFYRVRKGKGSHEIWGNDTGLTFPIPGAPGKELKEGTLRSILRSAGIKLEDLKKKKN
jgi:predicted RNA binding protein YcfA (HicA-like mRNA interferase family)